MVGIRFGGGRDELLTFMQCLGVITPPYQRWRYHSRLLDFKGHTSNRNSLLTIKALGIIKFFWIIKVHNFI